MGYDYRYPTYITSLITTHEPPSSVITMRRLLLVFFAVVTEPADDVYGFCTIEEAPKAHIDSGSGFRAGALGFKLKGLGF